MNKKLGWTVVLLIIVFGLAGWLITGKIGREGKNDVIEKTEVVVGGDRDAHGCIGSAGYSWCEIKKKCLRVWEEKCEPDETVDWKIYTNKKFGFGLRFPKTWDGYVVSEADYPDYSQVSFSFKGGHQPFSLLTVTRYSNEQWKKVTSTPAPQLKVLSQTEEETLVCDGCCGEGDTTGGGQFDRFQMARCKEGGQIIKTFYRP